MEEKEIIIKKYVMLDSNYKNAIITGQSFYKKKCFDIDLEKHIEATSDSLLDFANYENKDMIMINVEFDEIIKVIKYSPNIGQYIWLNENIRLCLGDIKELYPNSKVVLLKRHNINFIGYEV
jgi:uncharacterized iron-regulated protein